MTVIFSSERREGLVGIYATPALATIIDFNGATLAYTDNKRLIALGKEAGVEVRDFPKQPPTGKVEKNTPPPKSEETVTPSNDVLGPLVMTPVTAPTTAFDDLMAGNLSDEAIINKHGITKRQLTAQKRKVTIAKKAQKDS